METSLTDNCDPRGPEIAPIEGSERIETLDYLRGFALLGIIFVNVAALLAIRHPASRTPDASYERFLYMFVEGRFYTIFSYLFGLGFYLFITRANQKGANGIILFLRRLLALFVFGLIHLRFHPGEALTVYAICGLLVFPFYWVPKRVNFLLGVAMLSVLAIFSIKIFMTLPLMILGIASGQYYIFEKLPMKTKELAYFTVSMFVFSFIALGFQLHYAPAVLWAGTEQGTQRFLDVGVAVGPIVSAFYGGLFVLILQMAIIKKLLFSVKQYGRMALTNYLLQTVLLLVTGNLFKLAGQITYMQSLFLCIVICSVQLAFSVIWLRYFRFGPMEWIWRMLTYKNIPPMIRGKS